MRATSPSILLFSLIASSALILPTYAKGTKTPGTNGGSDDEEDSSSSGSGSCDLVVTFNGTMPSYTETYDTPCEDSCPIADSQDLSDFDASVELDILMKAADGKIESVECRNDDSSVFRSTANKDGDSSAPSRNAVGWVVGVVAVVAGVLGAAL